MAASRDLTAMTLAELKREELACRFDGPSLHLLPAIRIEIRRDEIKAHKQAQRDRMLALREREVELAERQLEEAITSREQMAKLVEQAHADDNQPPFPPFFSNRVGRG